MEIRLHKRAKTTPTVRAEMAASTEPVAVLAHRYGVSEMRVRAGVERICAEWKGRRSLERCRYVGLTKNALHFTLLAMAHRRWSKWAA